MIRGNLVTKPLNRPTGRLEESPCRSSEDSLERMSSQQFSERLKAAKFDEESAELVSLNMTPSSSSHTLGALSDPETPLLLLFSMILRREFFKKRNCLKKSCASF